MTRWLADALGLALVLAFVVSELWLGRRDSK